MVAVYGAIGLISEYPPPPSRHAMSAAPQSVVVVDFVSPSQAHLQIEHWHRLTRGDDSGSLYYRSESTLGKVQREGIVGAGQGRQPRPTWLSPEVVALDRLISQMPPELREALLLDQKRSLRMRDIAARLGTTPAEARRAIDSAYGFVAGVLTERMRG
jgi:hypothetical protein